MQEGFAEYLVIGRIRGVFGVRGGLRIQSFSRPPENILNYPFWYTGRDPNWRKFEVIDARPHGKGFVARLIGISDRDKAGSLIGEDIAILRSQLVDPPAGEYYWADLIGVEVVTTDGKVLGVVNQLIETGANDVLVVKGEKEHLIPYVPDIYVISVDTVNRKIQVDWDPD